jgi:hypothetical protein
MHRLAVQLSLIFNFNWHHDKFVKYGELFNP